MIKEDLNEIAKLKRQAEEAGDVNLRDYCVERIDFIGNTEYKQSKTIYSRKKGR